MVRADQPLLVLVALEGPCVGQRASKQSAKFVVGRRKNVGFCLNDSAVSERHAEVTWGGTVYTLRDLGSSNGTTHNNKLIAEGALARQQTTRRAPATGSAKGEVLWILWFQTSGALLSNASRHVFADRRRS
jgi:pSer/pThr/pTyr-binding forkhead associated (FHA) protein